MRSSEQLAKRALGSSLKQLMKEKPFDKIRVDDICTDAGVSRRNFYRYFPDKYALLNWIYYMDFVMDNEHYQGWVIWDYFPGICTHLYSDRDFYSNAFKVDGQNSFRDFCYERLYPILHNDLHNVFSSEKEEEFYLRRIIYIFFDGFVDWLKSEPCMPPDEYAKKVHRDFARLITALDRISNRPLVSENSCEKAPVISKSAYKYKTKFD